MKTIFVLGFILFVTLLSAVSVTFLNSDQLMHYASTWMFNYRPDDGAFYRGFIGDGYNKIVVFGDLCYARRSYEYIYWTELGPVSEYSPLSQSFLTGSDSFPPLVGVTMPDTTYHFVVGDRFSDTKYKLCAFNHLNTVNGNNPWAILNQAGDCRIYSGATAYIEKNISTTPGIYQPVTKLKLLNSSFYSLTPYPWNIGSGEDISGYGWGTIDPSEGDAAWIAAFANFTGQVDFTFTSPSAVVQNTYGLYTSAIHITPSTIKRSIVSANAVAAPYQLDASAENDVILNVQSGNYYYQNQNAEYHDCMVAKFYEQPVGSFPINIDKVYNEAYWELGTTYNDCTTSAVFELGNVPGISVPQNIRLLRRTNGFGSIWYDTNASVLSLDPLRLQVSGYNITGQYCVASTGGNNLEIDAPLSLTITRNLTPTEHIYLEWTPVSNAQYYNVYAAESPDTPESEWQLLAHLQHPICATTTSANPAKKFYFVKAEK
jgi:hypothetical protein